MKIRLIKIGLLPTIVVAEKECNFYGYTDIKRPTRAIVINDEYYYLLRDIIPQILKLHGVNYEKTFSVTQDGCNKYVRIEFPIPVCINVLSTIIDQFEVRGDEDAIHVSTPVSGKPEISIEVKVEEILEL